MSEENDSEKTQIFLRPAGSAAPTPPRPAAPEREVLLKPPKPPAVDTTNLDFDITGSGEASEHAAASAPAAQASPAAPAARPQAQAAAPAAPAKSSSAGLVIGMLVVVAVAVAVYVFLR